jgi:hypothetical protein
MRGALLPALACALMLSAPARAAVVACPAEVRVSFPNFEIAPYVLGKDRIESPPGLLVEWTRKALSRAGCKANFTLKRRPPNRQLAELELGLIDILPGFSYSADNASQLAFPTRDGGPDAELAVMSDFVSLYARAGDTSVKWDGKTLSSPNPLVGTSTGGSATNETAGAHGWTTESAPTPQADLRKLLAKRIDVIMEPEVVLGPYLTGADRDAVRKLSPPVRMSQRYAPVRKAFREAYPEFTNRFWYELCKASREATPGAPACRQP